jgi:aminomethyltransferase
MMLGAMSAPTASATPPKRTPLYDRHVALSARVIDFGGWAMPVQYSGIVDEHTTVRERVGLFDVSHMGEALFEGPGATAVVQRLVTNDVGRIKDGRAMYTVACLPSGGIVDDCIVYRQSASSFLIVINASNIDKDLGWFRENNGPGCTISDLSDETGLIAVQGPRAVALLTSLSPDPLADVAPFGFVATSIAGQAVKAARTGYTGEDGFELFCPAARTAAIWDALIEAAQPYGGKPIGLGARDTLRLEARLCLYGNDIDEEHSPLQAGLAWVVKGQGYIGEAALAAERARGVERHLVGFVMKERGIARHGYTIHALGDASGGGPAIGVVTSGTTGPTVGAAIGMGYVPAACSEPGQSVLIDCRGKRARAEIVKGPFYKRPR